MDKLSYALGLVIGHNLKEMGVDNLNGADFAQAVADVLAGNATTMTNVEAQQIVATYMQEKEAEKGKAAREAGEKFLAENAKKKGVKVTPSGLQYKILVQGKGEIPTLTSKVKVHYRGTLIDGTEFDNSYDRFSPSSFRVDQVIKGWTEALLMMPVGSKWELYIPHELAYGGREMGDDIKPFSALILEIELLEIE